MPTELLSFPPSYTLVGLYRLLSDPALRVPVWAKVKHAAVRGAAVGAAYAVFGWGIMRWAVRRFVLRGREGRVTIGHGALALSVDLVFYTHLLILLPQLGAIMHFFVKKNLRIARARAYALTVASRGKPAEFWSQGYVEEWAQPPVPTAEQKRAWGARKHQEKWVRWVLFPPVKMVIKNFILLPLSPTLPLLAPLFFCSLRALRTGEFLHQPYFKQKHMSKDQVWTWLEERKWAYRSFGFVAAVLETMPIIGLLFSVSNNVGAAMWAHDLEKRQHLFGHGILQRLPPSRVGMFGCGSPLDITPSVVKAEKAIEARWSSRPAFQPDVQAYDPEKPHEDYPDQPPAYESVAGSASSGLSTATAGVGSAAHRVPPALPVRPGDKMEKLPGAF